MLEEDGRDFSTHWGYLSRAGLVGSNPNNPGPFLVCRLHAEGVVRGLRALSLCGAQNDKSQFTRQIEKYAGG